MFVALRMIGIDTARVNADADPGGLRIFGIVAEFTREFIEISNDKRVPKITRLESDKSMLAGDVDILVGRHCLAGKKSGKQ